MKTIRIERTKSGLPAIWEKGGGATNTGNATIVCNADGSPKKAVYIRRKGHLSNGEHALIVVREGDIIISARHHRRDFNIEVLRIASIEGDHAEAEVVDDFGMGEWSGNAHEEFEAAIDAAMKKATAYHCRSPYYIKEEQ